MIEKIKTERNMNKLTFNPCRYLALAAIVAMSFTVAVATPGVGVTGTVFARASQGFADPTDLKFKFKTMQGEEVIQVRNAQDTVIQQIIIAPGGHTGWHTHPGPVVVLIKSGDMSFYDADDPTSVRLYSANESFIDSGQGHVHIARNEGATNLELWVTYFDVPSGGAFRIDAPAPGN